MAVDPRFLSLIDRTVSERRTHLRWSHDQATSHNIEYFIQQSASMGEVTSLRFHWWPWDEIDMTPILAHVPQLTTLEIPGSAVTNDQLACLAASAPRLASLELFFASVTDEGLEHLTRIPTLTSLRLYLCQSLTDAGLSQLVQRLPGLRDIAIVGFEIGDEGLIAIARHLKDLRSLNVSGDHVTRAGIEAIASHAHHLAALEIGDADEAIVDIVGHRFPRLNRLAIRHSTVTDDGVEAICRNKPGLASLTLSSCRGLGGDTVLAITRYLTGLRSLSLSQSRWLTDDHVARCTTLRRLTSLNLCHCPKLTDGSVRTIARNLPALSELRLRRCTKLTNASVREVALHLTRLSKLDLGGCTRITDTGLAALLDSPVANHLTVLGLQRAGTTIGDEFLATNDALVILQELQSLRSPLDEARIVLIGEGGIGKSNLRERLARNDAFFHEPQHLVTEGIEMRSWALPGSDVRFRIWDFGGQRHLHASHRFFFSPRRNLYVLVLDATRSRVENRLDYWLSTVRCEAGDAPVVLIVTRCDEPGRRLDRLDDAFVERLARDFESATPARPLPNIVGVVEDYGWSSACRGSAPGVLDEHRRRHEQAHERLLDTLREAVGAVPEMNTRYRREFFEVKSWLESVFDPGEERDGVKFIMRTTAYRAACEEVELPVELQDPTLQVMRNLGVCHWVGDRRDLQHRARLQNCIVNPAWVKDLIYRIVNAGSVAANGVLTHRQIAGLLPEVDQRTQEPQRGPEHLSLSAEERELVLDLMGASGLCFRIPDDENGPRYLIPDLLQSAASPSTPPRGKNRIFEIFQYDFLPDEVLMRFVAAWYPRVVDPQRTMFRDEVSVEKHGCTALLVADTHARTITVSIGGGGDAERNMLLGAVREKLESIRPRPLDRELTVDDVLSGLKPIHREVFEQVSLHYCGGDAGRAVDLFVRDHAFLVERLVDVEDPDRSYRVVMRGRPPDADSIRKYVGTIRKSLVAALRRSAGPDDGDPRIDPD